MISRNRVDVVIADAETKTGAERAAHQQTPDGVDVAPDPARRIIMVAVTKAAGAEEAQALGFEPVAVVTPRSPQAAYGVAADEVRYSEALTREERATLEPHVAPALLTSGVD
jgi:hypothetical protein